MNVEELFDVENAFWVSTVVQCLVTLFVGVFATILVCAVMSDYAKEFTNKIRRRDRRFEELMNAIETVKGKERIEKEFHFVTKPMKEKTNEQVGSTS